MSSTSLTLASEPYRGLSVELLDEIIGSTISSIWFSRTSLDSYAQDHWLVLYHTCRLFRQILNLRSHPFQEFAIFCDNDPDTNSVPSFEDALKSLARWAEIYRLISYSNGRPATLAITFKKDRSMPFHHSNLSKLFGVIGDRQVHLALRDLSLDFAMPSIRQVDCPPFPNLTHLSISADVWQPHGSSREPERCFHIRAPRLLYLHLDINDVTPLRIDNGGQVRTLQLNLSRFRVIVPVPVTLGDILLGNDALIRDFVSVSHHLTQLEIAMNPNSLGGIRDFHFPVLTSLLFRTSGRYRLKEKFTPIRFFAPLLETAQFLISDTRLVDFPGSCFAMKLRHLMLKTPAFDVPGTFSDRDSAWTFPNFIIPYPSLEEVVIAVHGLSVVQTSLPRVLWPTLKRMTLALEPRISQFLSHVDIPSVTIFEFVFPSWYGEELLFDVSHGRFGLGIDDSSYDDDDPILSFTDEDFDGLDSYVGSEGSSSELEDDESRTMRAVEECYDMEEKMLAVRFGGVVRKRFARLHPDADYYDVMGERWKYKSSFSFER